MAEALQSLWLRVLLRVCSPPSAGRHHAMINLSPAARALLDVLQLRCGVSIDVVDPALRPLQPEVPSDFAGMVDEHGVRERCLAVLRSGESRIERSLPVPVALFPLRRDREIVGLVIVARRQGPVTGLLGEDDARQLDAAGQIARAVLETDLALGAQLAQARDRTRRLQGILRFIGQMAARDGEREMMQAIVQAATVWFDLDCRIYSRDPDGSYALFAALPGIDRGEIKARLDGARLLEMVASRRATSASDLEVIGWPGRRGEALLFGVGPSLEWVLVLTGVFDGDVEPTFVAIAHVMAGELQQAAGRRVERWQQTLAEHASAPDAMVERVMLSLLEDLVASTDAAGARLLVDRGGAARTLAAVNPGGETAGGHSLEPFAHPFPVVAGGQARLELWPRDDPFAYPAFAQVNAWVSAVLPWLSGNAAGTMRDRFSGVSVDDSAFERRIQEEIERAKRFNLALSLVIVESGALDTIRPQLRSSDLLGRIRGGLLAVLLVHSAAEGADSLVARLRQRLGAMMSSGERAAVRLGQAVFGPEYQTADALIRAAMDALHRSGAEA